MSVNDTNNNKNNKIRSKNIPNEIKTDETIDMTINLLDIANKENLFTVHPKLHS